MCWAVSAVFMPFALPVIVNRHYLSLLLPHSLPPRLILTQIWGFTLCFWIRCHLLLQIVSKLQLLLSEGEAAVWLPSLFLHLVAKLWLLSFIPVPNAQQRSTHWDTLCQDRWRLELEGSRLVLFLSCPPTARQKRGSLPLEIRGVQKLFSYIRIYSNNTGHPGGKCCDTNEMRPWGGAERGGRKQDRFEETQTVPSLRWRYSCPCKSCCWTSPPTALNCADKTPS